MSDRIKIKASIHKRNVTKTWDAVLEHGSVIITKRGSSDMILMTVEHHEALLTQAKLSNGSLLKDMYDNDSDDDGWIAWKGGDNPVPGKRVQITMCGWPDEINHETTSSDDQEWQRERNDFDIIRYRVIEGATS